MSGSSEDLSSLSALVSDKFLQNWLSERMSCLLAVLGQDTGCLSAAAFIVKIRHQPFSFRNVLKVQILPLLQIRVFSQGRIHLGPPKSVSHLIKEQRSCVGSPCTGTSRQKRVTENMPDLGRIHWFTPPRAFSSLGKGTNPEHSGEGFSFQGHFTHLGQELVKYRSVSTEVSVSGGGREKLTKYSHLRKYQHLNCCSCGT